MADNEMIVLIYDTLQKQLNEMKNSRVVVQSLCDRVTQLEKSLEVLDKRTRGMDEKLEVTEMVLKGLSDTSHSNKTLAATVNALRSTIEHVTNPSISLIATVHKEIKQSLRELSSIHKDVMNEFEQYELRLVRTEDNVRQIKHNTLLNTSAEENTDDE